MSLLTGVGSFGSGWAFPLISIALNGLTEQEGPAARSAPAPAARDGGHCGQTPLCNFPVGNLSPKRKRTQ